MEQLKLSAASPSFVAYGRRLPMGGTHRDLRQGARSHCPEASRTRRKRHAGAIARAVVELILYLDEEEKKQSVEAEPKQREE